MLIYLKDFNKGLAIPIANIKKIRVVDTFSFRTDTRFVEVMYTSIKNPKKIMITKSKKLNSEEAVELVKDLTSKVNNSLRLDK